MYFDSGGQMMLKDIAAELGVSADQIRKWKREDKKASDDWDSQLNGHVTNANSHVTNERQKPARGAPAGNKNAVGHGAPKGNTNAAGNPGGGAPQRNQNAVRTGEYVSLWEDALTDEERQALDRVDLDPLAQFNNAIRLYEFRELTILRKIREIENGLTEKARRVLMERQKIKETVQLHDERSGQSRSVPVERHDLVVQSIEEMEYRKLDDLLKLEEALTRTTERKNKVSKDKAAYLSDLEKLGIAKEKLELEKTRLELEALAKIGGDNDKPAEIHVDTWRDEDEEGADE